MRLAGGQSREHRSGLNGGRAGPLQLSYGYFLFLVFLRYLFLSCAVLAPSRPGTVVSSAASRLKSLERRRTWRGAETKLPLLTNTLPPDVQQDAGGPAVEHQHRWLFSAPTAAPQLNQMLLTILGRATQGSSQGPGVRAGRRLNSEAI
ncbi:hypothetical protein GQ53DRAFT_110751 [Thozetella sp. PMI_491]|nr:hypothetical protein GQ53DRAFT_110751 [Thozetella sp. PMI_491]